mmetsp:Transcript_52742/g.122744  ORF Transcript_52742/g.122744 Transcript_52742/m.122744 type:complete len:89 (+) Transcript_52742:1487-1753(+)
MLSPEQHCENATQADWGLCQKVHVWVRMRTATSVVEVSSDTTEVVLHAPPAGTMGQRRSQNGLMAPGFKWVSVHCRPPCIRASEHTSL